MSKFANVKITSDGSSFDTEVTVDGVKLKGVISIEIPKITADIGPIVATITCYVDKLDIAAQAKIWKESIE